MNSIRTRLLVFILGILTLGTVAVCLSTYLGIRHEMDELYDANMRQLARTVSNMPLAKGEPASPLPFSHEWPHGEEVFLIQIWENGKLEYSSHPVADFPLQKKAGYHHSFFNNNTWGYYQEEINGHTVQISQEVKDRHEVIREVYNAILIPILIQFPLLAILVWFCVGYGFRPLVRVSNHIQTRTANYMEPIAPDDAPKEVGVMVGALNDLLRRLKLSLDTQRQFTADAAHELRTPLTALRLQLDLLNRADKPEDRHEAIETLERGVNRSIRMVQQLLELARQEPDNAAQELSQTDLKDIIQIVAAEHRPIAQKKSIDLTLELNELKINGNSASMGVLVSNLLTNAINYTGDGGRIVIKTYKEGNKPVFEIADDGIGIPPEERTRVFDRFYRVIGTNTTGSGLGLSIVRNILERHGAGIELSTGIGGKGTCFRIIFPDPLSIA